MSCRREARVGLASHLGQLLAAAHAAGRRAIAEWLLSHRINVNVRQVYAQGEPAPAADPGVDPGTKSAT